MIKRGEGLGKSDRGKKAEHFQDISNILRDKATVGFDKATVGFWVREEVWFERCILFYNDDIDIK